MEVTTKILCWKAGVSFDKKNTSARHEKELGWPRDQLVEIESYFDMIRVTFPAEKPFTCLPLQLLTMVSYVMGSLPVEPINCWVPTIQYGISKYFSIDEEDIRPPGSIFFSLVVEKYFNKVQLFAPTLPWVVSVTDLGEAVYRSSVMRTDGIEGKRNHLWTEYLVSDFSKVEIPYSSSNEESED